MTHARIAPGCRRLTEAHLHVEALAKEFHGLPQGVSKGQALAAFKRAASALGISPRLRDALDVLFAFSAPQDWQAGNRPMVWPSNRTLGSALCLGRRQVQNVLNALIRARLITPVDSPTGKRWGRRDPRTGQIVEAYGFDLSPIGLRYGEFVDASRRAAQEERERAALRRRITIARKAIRQIAETAIEYALPDRDWRQWTEEAIALAHTIADETVISALIRVVTELEDRRRDGQAALTRAWAAERPCGKSEDIAPSGANDCAPNTPTIQPSADTSATGRNDSGTARSGEGEAHTPPHPVSLERSEEELPSITPRFILHVSPELRDHIVTAAPTWADIVEAAHGLRRELGISRSAWVNACQTLGRYQAATAVAVIAAKRETIRSPGGYLRGMIGRAQNGELRLLRSLHGLAGRSRR